MPKNSSRSSGSSSNGAGERLLGKESVPPEDPALEIAKQRWTICLQVTLLVFAVYLAVRVVGWLFSNASNLPSFPSSGNPQEWNNPLCAIPVASYNATPDIVAQCTLLHQWESLAGISRVLDGGCYFDEKTSVIECSRDESCHGGQQQVHTLNQFHNNLTYDCGHDCDGTLRVNCCKTCESLRQSDEDKQWFHCAGCDKKELENIVGENPAACRLDDGGLFSCESKETCNVVPNVDKVKTSNTLVCSVIPCNVCETPQLHAKCCSICLVALCGAHPSDRKVCTGCDRASLNQYTSMLT
jgi:hypothetical protein